MAEASACNAAKSFNSEGFDTLLLTAGVTLWAGLSLNAMASPWLGTKRMLLVLYIVLGSLALKRARALAARLASYASALLVYLFMASVALALYPLGFLEPWMTHDGCGFDPDGAGPDETHVGLRIMRERAQNIGATVEVASVPGSGTCVVLKLPERVGLAA